MIGRLDHTRHDHWTRPDRGRGGGLWRRGVQGSGKPLAREKKRQGGEGSRGPEEQKMILQFDNESTTFLFYTGLPRPYRVTGLNMPRSVSDVCIRVYPKPRRIHSVSSVSKHPVLCISHLGPAAVRVGDGPAPVREGAQLVVILRVQP